MKIKLLLILLISKTAYAIDISDIAIIKQNILQSAKQKQVLLYYYLKSLVEKNNKHLALLKVSDLYKIEHNNEIDPLNSSFRQSAVVYNTQICQKYIHQRLVNYGINIENAVNELIENRTQKINIAQEILCNLTEVKIPVNVAGRVLHFDHSVKNFLNLAIKSNETNFIKLLHENGFLFKEVKGLEVQSIGNETQNNPLHVLVQASDNHEDPIGMAKLLVKLGAKPVRCNKLNCLSLIESLNLKNSEEFKFPHEVLYEKIKDDL